MSNAFNRSAVEAALVDGDGCVSFRDSVLVSPRLPMAALLR